MIRAFGKLRQKLLSGGIVARYLGYAAGEILLIVGGILIALRINDWAEDRKNRRFEVETLAQIHRNLELDYAALAEVRDNRRRAVASIDRVLAIEQPAGENQDLQYWLADAIHFDRFHSITNAYEVLKSRGLHLVENDELRLHLGIYYDGWGEEIGEHYQDLEFAFFEIWMPMLREDFSGFAFHQHARPADPAAFVADRRVRNSLRLERDNHESAAEHTERMMAVNGRLRQLIETDTRR